MIDLPRMDRRTYKNKLNNIQRGYIWKCWEFLEIFYSCHMNSESSLIIQRLKLVKNQMWAICSDTSCFSTFYKSESLDGMFKLCNIMCSQQLHMGVSTRDAPICWYQHLLIKNPISGPEAPPSTLQINVLGDSFDSHYSANIFTDATLKGCLRNCVKGASHFSFNGQLSLSSPRITIIKALTLITMTTALSAEGGPSVRTSYMSLWDWVMGGRGNGWWKTVGVKTRQVRHK